MPVLIRMPEIITGMSEGVLLAWLVDIGATVEEGTPLAEVETDKAVVEYLSEDSGTLVDRLKQPGQPIAIGEPIAVLALAGESPEDAANMSAPSEPASAEVNIAGGVEDSTERDTARRHDPPEQTRRFVTPLVRRLARERGINLESVAGSGAHGRIVRSDLEKTTTTERTNGYRTEEPPPSQSQSQSLSLSLSQIAADGIEFTDTEISPMRRVIARRLTESKTTVPHFYLQADCRVDALVSLRRTLNDQLQQRLSLNDFIIRAVGCAFTAVPEANAVWNDTTIRRLKNVDIGIAVAIEGGLVTPVLRDVARKTVGAIAAETRDLTDRARAGRITPAELKGGSFCISNLGMYGIERFAAIINPPQSGILAVGTANQRPVVTDGEIRVATISTVTFSGDHRVFDGALGAQWLTSFVAAVEEPMTLLV